MISVIIPTYNASKTIQKTLASLVSQTNQDFKVIIINDQSKDSIELEKIVDLYKNFLNITYYTNEENIGCGASRAQGEKICDTDYFTFIDADDVFLPYTIDIFYDAIRKYPECDVFISDFFKEYANSTYKTVEMPYTWCHGKLYKKEFIDKNGIEIAFKGTSEDAYLNAICCELGDCRKIPYPTMIWCINKDSITRNPNRGYLEFFFSDYVRALRTAAEFVFSKGKIPSFLYQTTEYINYRLEKESPTFSDNEKERASYELNLYKKMLENIENSDLIKQKIKEKEEADN